MRAIVASILLSLFLPPVLSAQAVSGLIAVVESEERVQGAEIALVDASGITHVVIHSGENGEFFLEAPSNGTFEIRVRRIGFKPASARVVLQTDRVLEIRLNLAPQATQLEGVTVYGQTAETPEQREFLSRRHLPWNFSYDMREIEAAGQGRVSELLAYSIPFVPGCRVVYLDGRYSHVFVGGVGDIDPSADILTSMAYGVEVYRTWFDIPSRYREPALRRGALPSQRCGAVLIWRKTPSGYGTGIPTMWSGALGWGFGWERELFDLGWRRGTTDVFATAVRLRIGRHSPIELLRSTWSESGPLDPNQKPLFLSLYIGKQGPMPLLPPQQVVYTRFAVGGSLYLGQPSRTDPFVDTLIAEAGSPAYFGMGGEVAVGVRYPRGPVRPWFEVRTGSEWVMNAGPRWAKPVLMVGLEVGGRRQDED